MDNRRRLLSVHGSYREYVIHDPDRPDDLIIETEQDCEPIIEMARRLSEMSPGKDFRHVGFIPDFLMAQAKREGWLNDRKRWKQVMNDPDNRAFRTWPGRL